MQKFAALYHDLTIAKNAAIKSSLFAAYLRDANKQDLLWAIRIVAGVKWEHTLKIKEIIQLAIKHSGIPEWLMEESHSHTGDWIETISLVMGKPGIVHPEASLHQCMSTLEPWSFQNPESMLEHVWQTYTDKQLFLIHKMISGTNRKILPLAQVAYLLHQKYGTERPLLQYRLHHDLTTMQDIDSLIQPQWSETESSYRPIPFIQPKLIQDIHNIPGLDKFMVEPAIQGVRLQILKFNNSVKIWDIEQQWLDPEKKELLFFSALPEGTIIECIKQETLFHFIDLHRWGGEHLGSRLERKSMIKLWLEDQPPGYMMIPGHLQRQDVSTVETLTKGWVFKPISYDLSQDWFRIKAQPHELIVELMYAEIKNQNSSLESLLTLGIKGEEGVLLPLLKLESDILSASLQTELYHWIQNNTVQKFGPVRTVRSGQLFRIAYDRYVEYKKVKAGIKLINVQLISWIRGYVKPEVSLLQEVKGLIE